MTKSTLLNITSLEAAVVKREIQAPPLEHHHHRELTKRAAGQNNMKTARIKEDHDCHIRKKLAAHLFKREESPLDSSLIDLTFPHPKEAYQVRRQEGASRHHRVTVLLLVVSQQDLQYRVQPLE